MSEIQEELNIRLNPPLKWAGGKRWLVPFLHDVFKSCLKTRLVEPFVGGMAVALGLNPKKALLNDLNNHLINFYQWIQNGLVLSIEFKNEREFFFKSRERFNELVLNNKSYSKESAELFYYLNRTSFNGLCRFNSKGQYNVPFGKYSKIEYVKDFLKYKEVFQKWQLSCQDFELLKINKSDLLYVDPPYDTEFTKYSKEDFNWEDQIRLVNWLSKQSCKIIASNQATDRILDLYRSNGFEVKTLSAPRRISCTGDRKPTLEMLALKNF